SPNPNKGVFSIQLSEVMDNYSVIIIDALGREIFNAEYNQTADLVQNIELDNTLSGMYFVTIQSKGAQITKKIIIE
ncbi:MAG: T9SS C-terminal target domain-containing protein, partial [Flavobacteriia bacterium]